ncbi:F0F1 ATP synthase subunit delta [Dehalobacterium formicoaceticum]|uniref:ATP synthase subunit delta n=1 Tax=Dehalobacterium formicoaceticum TaxID=51515 RepID=A0ABT1Y6W1_9FIRM|nr:F0F1 ATP synthase subunit delta [Dehalobacterium formicoaceticum]MCR6545426.1 F0F1 ATP synthase subunit delta [Dehalobacterium formicoaceticum]
MINKTIARRYAQAIFAIAQEKNLTEEYARDLKKVIQLIEGNEDLKILFYGRFVPSEAKKEAVSKIIADELDPMVANFIYLLLDKSRENYLTGIAEVFNELVAEKNRIMPAQVRTAIPLTKNQVQSLEKKLSQITGRNIQAEIQVEPSLIGGMSVRIGDTVYDGSIFKQLSLLKEHLQQNSVGKIGVRQ